LAAIQWFILANAHTDPVGLVSVMGQAGVPLPDRSGMTM
jgi:hypothetical protein